LVGPTKNLQSSRECEFLFIIFSGPIKTKNSEQNGKLPSKIENTKEMAKHRGNGKTLSKMAKHQAKLANID
jgi:hypothetical protein